MKSKYFILFRNNKICLKNSDNGQIFEYSPLYKNEYFNIPFYCFLFDDKEIWSFRKFFFEIAKIKSVARIFSKVLINNICLLVPDDVIKVEKRLLYEFILVSLNPKNCCLINEGLCVIQEKINYVVISKSCRMITISYVENQSIKAQRFLENKEYSVEEMKGYIINLHDDFAFNMPAIYLNGQELSRYSELGTVIEGTSLFNNISEMSNGDIKYIDKSEYGGR